MATTTRTVECVCVWLDGTSDPARPSWIVSHDRLNEDGSAAHTDTIEGLDSDEAEAAAIEDAISEGRKRGLPVYHRGTAKHGQGFPRRTLRERYVHIRDGIGHCHAVYRLTPDGLECRSDGGCGDVLARVGCDADYSWTDAGVIDAVWDAWTADGYDGDPDANGLAVTIEETSPW